ncbi:MAG: GGDEF domain-containing protein [Bacteroidota bacterium]
MSILFLYGILLVCAAAVAALARFLAVGRRLNQAFMQLGEAAGGGLGTTEAGRRVLAALCTATRSEAGLLYLQDERPAGLRLRASMGLDQGELSRAAVETELRHSLADLTAAQNPVAIAAKDRRSFLAGFSSALGLRLTVGDRMVGAVLLLRRRRRHRRLDREFLGRVAHHAALGLDSANLNQRTRHATEENARLYLNLSHFYRQATVDSLTGLPNRSFMYQRLREEIKKSWRFKQPLSLVLLDLDRLAAVNETHGQDAGDEVLRETARFLRRAARDYDVVCRYGGGDFMLILPHTDADGALALAERLRRGIAGHEFPRGCRLTCSQGVSSLIPTAPSRSEQDDLLARAARELVLLAEQAVRAAKEAGRNRVETAATYEP